MFAITTRQAVATVLAALVIFSAPAFSQVGHPAKGSWAGFLDAGSPSPTRIRLLIDDHPGAELSGVINPGRNSVTASEVSLDDADNWQLRIEADLPEGPLVMIGTLSNLGSWTNRKYIGTYTLGNNQGRFEITLN